MKKLIFIFFLILILPGCGAQQITKAPLVSVVNQPINAAANLNTAGTQATINNTPIVNKISNGNTNTAPKPAVLPVSFDLPVTFVSQAPFANWDYLHNEACEEASMIMAVKYLNGEKLDKQIMENEIQAVSKWEEDNGYAVDLTAAEVVKVLADYFGVKSFLSGEVTADKIKQELVSGNLVIVPLAGRDLGNPYYRLPGPIFHMLLLRGYDNTNFITNDPGTRHGEAYRYTYGDLLWAVHDWIGGARPADEATIDMSKGKKVMVIVEKIK